MGKKVQVSVSMDEDFIAELDEAIRRYSLANRSALIQKWARNGFEKLKEDHRIPLKREIAPEVSGKRSR